jgi:hypothetical protein
MTAKLNYVIKFVADMERAVKFYRDTLGLPLKFQSPGWSEFSTGETVLALHPASSKNPAGSVELGFNVPDLHRFYQDMTGRGCSSPCRRRSRISEANSRNLWTPKAGTSASAGEEGTRPQPPLAGMAFRYEI